MHMEELAWTISTSQKLKAALALITGIICHLQTSSITGLLLHSFTASSSSSSPAHVPWALPDTRLVVCSTSLPFI